MWLAVPFRLGSSFLFGCGPLAALSVGCGIPSRRQFLGHDDFRSPRTAGDNPEFIHERAHQEDAAPRGPQQIFLGYRVGHAAKVEAFTFVQTVNNHFFRRKIQSEVNLLFGALFVAVVKGIDDAFAHRHSDTVAVIFAESGSLRHAQTHFLGEIDTLDLRLQRNFEVLGAFGHAGASPAPNLARFWAPYG